MGFNFKSVKVKYALIGLAICLISLIVVSVISYLVSYNITSDLSDKMIIEKARRTSAELDYWFKNRQTTIDSLARNIEAFGDFSAPQLTKLLKKNIEKNQGNIFSDLYFGFADPNRELISAIDWIPPDDYEATARPWYKMAIASDGVIFTEPYVDANTGELVITVAKTVHSKGHAIGVLASDIVLKEVLKIVDAAKINDNSYGVLLDNMGRIIAHPNQGFLPTKDGLKDVGQINWTDYMTLLKTLLQQGTHSNIQLKGYTGKEEIFNFSKIASNGWYIGIAISKAEYQKPLQDLLLGFGGAFLISMIVGLIFMLKSIDMMVKPIKSLNNTVKQFSVNRLVRTSVLAEDEIGELAKNFNEMADTIHEYDRYLEKKVEARTRELQEKNDTIMDSIEYARRLQKAIIPDIGQRLGIPRENYFSIWQPRDLVGGDIYWCKGDDTEGVFVIADCTGHGVPGALMSMTLNSILDATFIKTKFNKPAEMMNLINTRLKEVLSQDKKDSEINDGADIALLYIDKMNKRLVYSGAKLDMFVVSEGNIQVVKGSRDSVGYSWGNKARYENVEVSYIEGGSYYFTTDGFLDQNSENHRGGIGRRGFASLIESIYHLPMEVQKTVIQDDLKEKLSKVAQRDDITIIGLKL